MIVHESVKGLLEEVAALKMRCAGLESANADLKGAMEAVEQVCAANAATVATNGNLTGYTSSDSGSQGISCVHAYLVFSTDFVHS